MSTFLTELLQLKSDRILSEAKLALLEHMGNLAVIDKDLLRALRTSVYKHDQGQATEHGLSARSTKAVYDKLGRGSQVVTQPGTTAIKALDLFDSDRYLAMVVKVGEQQVLMMADLNRIQGESKAGNTALLATHNIYDTVSEQDYLKALDPMGKQTYRLKQLVISGIQETKPKVKSFLTLLFSEAKKQDKPIELLFITRDSKRPQISAERGKARMGSEPVPKDNRINYGKGRYGRSEPSYAAHIDALKRDLKHRLDQYKSSKTPDLGSDPATMLKHIIEQGYLNKIRFMGEVYNYGTDRINFDKLRSGSKSEYDESYIEYKNEHGGIWHNEAYHNERKQVSAEAEQEAQEKGLTGQEAKDYVYDKVVAIRSKYPPSTIKVILKLEGGKIVPADIKFTEI